MIDNPYLVLIILFLVEACVLYISGRPGCKHYFHFIPPVFWIYAIPMLFSSSGLIAGESRFYRAVSENLLPASLILLLLSTDLQAIARLGRKALAMMLIGSLSIMIAIPTVFYLFKGVVGVKMWSGFGALSASWIGGSANMIAVKEALGTPDPVFSPMLVVDTVVPYLWMAALIGLAGMQKAFDKAMGSDLRIMDELNRRLETGVKRRKQITLFGLIALILVSCGGVLVSRYCASFFPEIKNTISVYTWVIIIASLLGIGLSLTPIRRLEEAYSATVGYWLLYFVLATIGARAMIRDFGAALVLVGAGFCVIAIHGFILWLAARLLRAPMFLAVTASQANVGGPASAPVVAAVYQPALASVGLLMAVLGNILGTYAGIITGYVCKLIAGV